MLLVFSWKFFAYRFFSCLFYCESFMALLKNVFPICLLCWWNNKKTFFCLAGVCMWKALSIRYQRLISLRKKNAFLAVENNGKNHKLINYLLWIVMKRISALWLTICRLFMLSSVPNSGLMNFANESLSCLSTTRVNMSGIN